MDSFVFDEYSRKVSQVSQFVVESKFIEAIKKLVEYGNIEFLRSFQLRSEIIKEGNKSRNGNGNYSNNDNNNVITTDVATLVPPFETIGFLEAKWLEVLKELVEYGNKNILGNFMLYLVMEEKREEQYVKEVTSWILDIKKEEKGIGRGRLIEVPNHNHNQSWSTRLRDKNGRFMSSGAATAAATITAASNTTNDVVTTTTPTITAKPPPSLSSPSWHNNKLRDSRGRFVASTAAPSAT
jgi:hypothetical protein